ncbi:MAG TPA: LysR family transcriptional regulator [Stellaceae bacterium]|jgi:LysR family transcriptional regulator, cyn operon transcriptional activator|nr:LysR family transcriptional regulator [Stellaceae bacterium]
MNLRFLRTFVAIADDAGVARAAARLNLTQSAASRQIQALENELGLQLFARIGRNVRLTPEGEDLLVRSRRLLADVVALGERASALKRGDVGVLRLGATPQVIESLLAGLLPRYGNRHSGVEVHLVEDGGARLPARLERGDVDLAIMPAGEDRFRARLLYPMHVLAILPQRHRLSRSAVLDVTELADEPLLRLTSSFASHRWFDAACQVAHVRPPVLLESVAPQTLIALAQAGHGIAVVPSSVRIPRARVRVAVVVHRGVPIGEWAVAAWEPQRFLPAYAEDFIEEVVAHCQTDYPGRAFVQRVPALPKPKIE